ncbi:hypothetical protein [Nonomuraea jabiensis]|uniref:Uncharacterized protein n=1 Tax=Nonomuraea jabiensis TaxID=882448 RepID=A0A7W9L8K7_9ACTN|nr:hypothetical protein [Nonomuraea jabiensis]MBB5774614.1 hypothetical protein [Nonomuraea jabiensis]
MRAEDTGALLSGAPVSAGSRNTGDGPHGRLGTKPGEVGAGWVVDEPAQAEQGEGVAAPSRARDEGSRLITQPDGCDEGMGLGGARYRGSP